jgi:hypothetical protein
MKDVELLERIDFYRSQLEIQGYAPVQFNDNDVPISISDKLSHARWMCEQMQTMLTNNEPQEKIHRWLGFVQCCLWENQKFTIAELRQHMRLP